MGEEVRKAVEMELEEMTWEKLMRKEYVRVLLVEPDDSTRQIIAALLRKCGYRVTTAYDGMKAWEILREKAHDIDLVLTEVELPQVSGIALLTLMMDQDSCKHIPLIMMSLNDSISLAFKCMIKGAADFLVKPIRKNELTNIWQHVWRKQKSEKQATQNKLINLNHDGFFIESATDMQGDIDCCEKESDAQSSCTRSDMEVESECKLPNKMELKQEQHKKFAFFDHFEKKLDSMVQFRNDASNGTMSSDSDTLPEERTESSTEVFDLIEVITTKSNHITNSENSLYHISDKETKRKASFLPSLELSLDGYPHIVPNRHELDEPNTLHHSNSSAFSLYNNNINVAPKLPQESPLYQFAANPPSHNGLISELSGQQETAYKCAPIRFISFPVPIGGTGHDCASSNPFLSFWGAFPFDFRPQLTESGPAPADIADSEFVRREDSSLDRRSFQADRSRDEDCDRTVGDVTCAGDDGGFDLNDNGISGASNESSRHENEGDGGSVFAGEGSGGINPGDKMYQLSRREAALTKFRLKRKERCFEKKVRYLSRKKLAEQRPRVKGQFVRQI